MRECSARVPRNRFRTSIAVLAVGLPFRRLAAPSPTSRRTIDLWHQMRPEDREVLDGASRTSNAEHLRLSSAPSTRKPRSYAAGWSRRRWPTAARRSSTVPPTCSASTKHGGPRRTCRRGYDRRARSSSTPAPSIHLPAPRTSRSSAKRAGLPRRPLRQSPGAGLQPKLILSRRRQTTAELVELAKAKHGRRQRRRRRPTATAWSGITRSPTSSSRFSPATARGSSTESGGAATAGPFPRSTRRRRSPLIDSSPRCNEHRVLPRSADYEAAHALFLAGKAAMIIDGDWSWQSISRRRTSTPPWRCSRSFRKRACRWRRWCRPRGTASAPSPRAKAPTMPWSSSDFLPSDDTQQAYLAEQRILPSRLALRDDPLVASDPVMASLDRAGRTRPSDADGGRNARRVGRHAAALPTVDGRARLDRGRRRRADAARRRWRTSTPSPSSSARRHGCGRASLGAIGASAGVIVWQRGSFAAFWRDLRRQPTGLRVGPCRRSCVIFADGRSTRLSTTSCCRSRTCRSPTCATGRSSACRTTRPFGTGGQGGDFGNVLLKTLVWTCVNVFFHVDDRRAAGRDAQRSGARQEHLPLAVDHTVGGAGVHHGAHMARHVRLPIRRGEPLASARSVGSNAYLPDMLQLAPVNWLGKAGPAFAACIIANVWLGFPFMMVIALGGMQGIPAELYEAARIDRASRWQQFRHITLPCSSRCCCRRSRSAPSGRSTT